MRRLKLYVGDEKPTPRPCQVTLYDAGHGVYMRVNGIDVAYAQPDAADETGRTVKVMCPRGTNVSCVRV
jgi:hypothetical protein